MDWNWYFELPGIFKAVVIALCIMIIMMAIVSGLYYLPKKNREMKKEIITLDSEIVKKKAAISNQNQAYVDLVEKHNKEIDRLTEQKAAAIKEKQDLLEQVEGLKKDVEKLEKQKGGRPPGTGKKTLAKEDKKT